jgi:hypothetical protein
MEAEKRKRQEIPFLSQCANLEAASQGQLITTTLN